LNGMSPVEYAYAATRVLTVDNSCWVTHN
jgi:hypothetical protein